MNCESKPMHALTEEHVQQQILTIRKELRNRQTRVLKQYLRKDDCSNGEHYTWRRKGLGESQVSDDCHMADGSDCSVIL